MDRIKEYVQKESFTRLLILLGSVLIAFFYMKNIPCINTVWELVDEYGYLANAAYMSGTDWSFMINVYYGYGYSILLIPLFWFCKTGVQIIRGAILVNSIIMVVLFWVQFALLSRIFPKVNRRFMVLISFALCFYPYLMTSSMKVICECLLTLMVWVCGLLMYEALHTGKWYYYMLLAVALVYTFLVHTRALVFCGVLLFVLVLTLLQKRNNLKKIFIFLGIFLAVLLLGFFVKSHVIDAVYRNELIETQLNSGEVQVGNTLTLASMWNQIVYTFKNLNVMHWLSFVCKMFYLFVATAGMFHIGFCVVMKEAFIELKKYRKWTPETAVKFMFAFSAFVVILATIIQIVGRTDATPYFFYGRYYEYIIGPLTCIGMVYCSEHKIRPAVVIALFASLIVFCIGTMQLSPYLSTQEFYMDSNRAPAFAYITQGREIYTEVIQYGGIFIGVVLLLVVLMNRAFRGQIALLIFLLFMLNNGRIVTHIVGINYDSKEYYNVAEHIHTYYEEDEIYFISGDLPYATSYAGLQSLLGKERLTMIEASELADLEAGDIVITYRADEATQNMEQLQFKVNETNWFIVYEIE